MAIVLTSGNLNTYGNNGQFETDPSGWGFGSNSNRQITRVGTYYSAGIRSCMAKVLVNPTFIFTMDMVPCSPINIVNGKTYIAKAKVRCNTANPPGKDGVFVSIDAIVYTGFMTDVVVTGKNVGDIKNATNDWFDIQTTFTATSTGTLTLLNLKLAKTIDSSGDQLFVNGALYVDQFEVYEYIEVDDTPPPPPDTDYVNAYLSKDPIPFELPQTSNSDEDNYSIFVDVRVEDETGSGIYNSKLKMDLPPEEDGFSRFNLRQAFVQDVLSAVPPSRNESALIKLTDRVKLFLVYYGDIFNSMIEPEEEDLTVSDLMLVMLGGTDKKFFPDIDFFNTYLPTNKKFLTWAPLVKDINFYQEEYLNFFIGSATVTTINVKVKCYYDDATNSTFTAYTQLVQRGDLWQIPCGPNHTTIAAHDITRNLIKYDVWLTNQADAVISETRTFKILPIISPFTRYFLFRNSLGSYDTLRCSGKSIVTVDISKTIRQKNLPINYEALAGELQADGALFQKKSDVSTGYLTGKSSKEWQQYLLDFHMSPEVYEITNGNRVPVVIKSDSMTYSDDDSFERYTRFVAYEAYNNHSFTPDVI
jgi:hypothetical protein